MVDLKDLKLNINTIPALKILTANIPLEYVDKINQHIDDVVVPNNSSMAASLVGQIKENKKSAQLSIDLDSGFGLEFKNVLDSIATSYIQNGYDRLSQAKAFQCWSIHSYSGDYNPFHSHGVNTPAGVSCILYLKVPDCISEKEDKKGIGPILNDASGDVDGFTQLIWGTNTRKEIYELRGQEQDYVKPRVGLLVMFPNWLNHQVMPYFGEGERRTLSANFDVFDSEEEKMKYMSKQEQKLYNESKENSDR
tara:strand:- start:1101 stop:1853 length:753 start_codon:yes stop_codon:yes gene_type:complete